MKANTKKMVWGWRGDTGRKAKLGGRIHRI